MADTSEGRKLTDAHRVAQVELSTQAMAAATLIWGELNPDNLPASMVDWLALETALLQFFDQRSAALAVEYLTRYRVIEDVAGPIAGVADFDAPRVRASLDLFGPKSIESKIALGVKPAEAKQLALGQFQGAIQRHALQGGRRVVDESTLANPRSVGWRRVSDGSPCAFCALLATRGPVYRTARTAGEGRRYHNKCGCSIEEVFGNWRPTSAERDYLKTYRAARKAVPGDNKGTEDILSEMRKRGFH